MASRGGERVISIGDAEGRLKVDVNINQSDLSVSVTLTGTVDPNGGNISQTLPQISVPKDQTVVVPEFDLSTGGICPDRAYFRGITITNGPATSI